MYFMHEIIVSLANHDIPKKLIPNCGMWARARKEGFFPQKPPQKQGKQNNGLCGACR